MHTAIRGLAVVALVAGASQLKAQLREQPRPEVRGVIKAIDASAGTMTVNVGEGRGPGVEKILVLSKNVEVGTGAPGRTLVRAATLAELSPGLTVSLALAGDQTTVESIVAEEPVVRGVLKQVDAAKGSVTITTQTGGRDQSNEEKSYALPADAEIGLDDGRGSRFSVKEGKLADLSAGAIVAARLSLDRKQVQSLVAEGPLWFGTVKSIDPAKQTLTLITRPARGDETAEERTLSLAANAVVMLDDGRGRRLSVKEGSLAEIPVGSAASAKLSADQSAVTLLRAEGPTLFGMLKSVDASKPAITIAIPRGRGDAPEEKTFAVAEGARISLDNNEAKLSDLKPSDDGPFVQLRLSLDQKQAQLVVARQPAGR